ncbi:sulfite exporter TauE/SafE family protein [Motilibacter deserti]|uniref:Probable membrane transporter protein n=1 Tax=Motilibacter deserti TaxID=2714956 RepID=A0ABX0GTL0_9ACTN|nr:sulfite exporter TauE/SafE family protein [Motilibacter deserti]NHC13476.1 sulfite exporter TauE/SafE family protein [Motilibacter deserti]
MGAVSGVEALWLAGAGFGAGLTGSIAGLASLVSYPALLAAGLTPIAANVTNTVAVVATGAGAAAGSRPELRGQAGRVRRYGAVMVVGGAGGAALLMSTPTESFEYVVPFLVAAASVLLLVQPRLQLALATRRKGEAHPHGWSVPALFGVAVYGGYFGAGAGVMTLAVLAALLQDTLVRLNALRNILLWMANGVAAVGFAVFGPVDWAAAAPMAAGLLAGGWTGPAIARRLPTGVLRLVVALGGLVLAARLWMLAGT